MASPTEIEEIREAKPLILKTVHDDGSADFTVQYLEEDHKFSMSENGELKYEESRSWLGVIRVSEPTEKVWELLLQSDAMTEYLDRHDIDKPVTKRN